MLKSLGSCLWFGVRRQKVLIVGLLVLFAMSCFYVQPWLGENSKFAWYSGWNVVINLSTLGVAIMVWFAGMRRDWEAALPKRLIAEFYHEGKLIMIAKNASLTSEGDVRPWAQQMGAQMAGTNNLGLQPRFEICSSIVKSAGETHNVYKIKMLLSKIPEKIEKKLAAEKVKTMNNPVFVMDAESNRFEAEVIEYQP